MRKLGLIIPRDSGLDCVKQAGKRNVQSQISREEKGAETVKRESSIGASGMLAVRRAPMEESEGISLPFLYLINRSTLQMRSD